MHIDLGAGDGSYVSSRAKQDARTFYIGVEPNHASFVEASRIAMRSAGKGEPAPLFVLGSWQDLPGELAGLAESVSVLFPWGSLLQAAATADPAFVEALLAISRPGATVELVTAIDPATDANELRRLGLGGFEPARMRGAWQGAGLEAAQFALPSDHPYQTTWWRRIRQRPGRVATLTRLRLPGPARLPPNETPRSR